MTIETSHHTLTRANLSSKGNLDIVEEYDNLLVLKAEESDWNAFQNLLSVSSDVMKDCGHGLPSNILRDKETTLGFLNPCRGPQEQTDGVRDMRCSFDFALPSLTKDEVKICCRRYAPFTKLLTERNKWPEGYPTFRSAVEDYADIMQDLADRVLNYIYTSRGLESDAARELVNKHRINGRDRLKISKYDGTSNLGAHKDKSGIITLLSCDAPGLEIEVNGEFQRLKQCERTIYVMYGGFLEAIGIQGTNHRVVSTGARFSVAYFVAPNLCITKKELASDLGVNMPDSADAKDRFGNIFLDMMREYVTPIEIQDPDMLHELGTLPQFR